MISATIVPTMQPPHMRFLRQDHHGAIGDRHRVIDARCQCGPLRGVTAPNRGLLHFTKPGKFLKTVEDGFSIFRDEGDELQPLGIQSSNRHNPVSRS